MAGWTTKAPDSSRGPSDGGAEGNRTPDLLIAKVFRLQIILRGWVPWVRQVHALACSGCAGGARIERSNPLQRSLRICGVRMACNCALPRRADDRSNGILGGLRAHLRCLHQSRQCLEPLRGAPDYRVCRTSRATHSCSGSGSRTPPSHESSQMLVGRESPLGGCPQACVDTHEVRNHRVYRDNRKQSTGLLQQAVRPICSSRWDRGGSR